MHRSYLEAYTGGSTTCQPLGMELGTQEKGAEGRLFNYYLFVILEVVSC